jgi:hypothetical protein
MPSQPRTARPGRRPTYSNAIILKAKNLRNAGVRWKVILRELNLPDTFPHAYTRRIK